MNCYLALPDRPKYSLAGYPTYYLVYVDPAYMVEQAAIAMSHIPKFRRPLIAESLGRSLIFEIISVAPTLEDIDKDLQKIKDWSWYVPLDAKDIQ
jgi:hypothetical protein